MILTKVVLGQCKPICRSDNVHHWVSVGADHVPMYIACAHRLSVCEKVIFDRMDDELNETVVYTNDAIRPVCLIVFG